MGEKEILIMANVLKNEKRTFILKKIFESKEMTWSQCHGSGYVQTTRAWRNTYIGGESREGEFLISSQFQR